MHGGNYPTGNMDLTAACALHVL